MTKKEEGFLAEFIFESDAIENIHDDLELLKQQINDNKKDGHVGAMLYLEELSRAKNCSLQEADIRLVQKLITAEQYLKPGGKKLSKKHIGHYRDCTVYVGGRLCPAPASVPNMMKEFVANMNLAQAFMSLEAIADLHFEYEHIHPFADGNGRSGRAIVYYLFRFAGFQPFIFTSHDKWETYYPAFDSKELMRQYFLNKKMKRRT